MTDTLHISCERADMDLAIIHRFLSTQAYWSRGIGRDTLARAVDGSLCFGGFVDRAQVAFARVITDAATFAYLADVFVLPDWRGRGFGRRLLEAVMAHPALQGLRRFTLATGDAHGLYAKFGFSAPTRPERLMEIFNPDIYTAARTS